MVDTHLRSVAPSSSKPFLEENRSPTQRARTFLRAVAELDPLTGTGNPEGVQAAKSRRFYADTDGNGLYFKFTDAIDNDPTQGWRLVSRTLPPPGDKNVDVSANYQVILGNENIRCDGTFTVTAVVTADASNEEITIKNAGTGVITFVADAPIEGSVTLTATQSQPWFFAGGQWNAK